jgi:hypothetical protein
MPDLRPARRRIQVVALVVALVVDPLAALVGVPVTAAVGQEVVPAWTWRGAK